MIRKLDMNDIENFKAVYLAGKENLWPLEKSAVVNDLRCLLETHIELNEDVRSFERELTTIARKPDRRQGESRVCFWLRRIGEQLAEEADRAEKMKVDLAEQEAAWRQDLRTGARALRKRDELRAALNKLALDWHGQGYRCRICGGDSQGTFEEKDHDSRVPRHEPTCVLSAVET